MKTKSIILLTVSATILTACSSSKKDYDATGTFEATEVTVSAEQTGRIMNFDITEGQKINQGAQVGLIDTVQLQLKALQMGATRETYENQKPDIQKQIAATRQQLATAEREQRRAANLVKDGAANQKQLDDANSAVLVLKRQLEAQISSLSNSTKSLSSQSSAADIQRAQIIDQLQKCHITTPINGTILDKYVEAGDFATIGKPLFKIADMDNVYLRAYVTSEQLEKVKTGQTVKVFSDYGNHKRKEYSGTITWISDHSEFTPKTIQTDDERADLVYAVKILVKNDGYIKLGMYGEVKL
ncbi:MAG: HlyD family efflux transporter periplasmic adaptor subunit [Bacteroidaceae bacterium]|nr:HlyD family efflux transporter periplasmic adaptor subunit [Bacteroidaceae bacterium]